MTPEDVRTVQESWPAFLQRRERVLATLARQFHDVPTASVPAASRASWLFRSVEELIELLPMPSRLERHARTLGEAWPDPLVAPSFAIDGRAWMCAAGECIPTWSADTEAAWCQAWRLLSEVLAAETLSPFSREGTTSCS